MMLILICISLYLSSLPFLIIIGSFGKKARRRELFDLVIPRVPNSRNQAVLVLLYILFVRGGRRATVTL
jgi:hypothetical protein